MRNLITVLVLLVAVGVGAGFYLGWFHISTGGSQDGTSRPSITVDHERIKADQDKAKGAVHDLEQKVKEKTAATSKEKAEAQNP